MIGKKQISNLQPEVKMRQEQEGHGAVAGVGSLRCQGWLNRLASPLSRAGCPVRLSRGDVALLLLAPPLSNAIKQIFYDIFLNSVT